MANIEPLSASRHGKSVWRRSPDWEFARSTVAIPLTIMELPRAIGQLPVAFLPQGEQYVLSAVLGIERDNNLFVDRRGRWRAAHVPAYLSTYPFRLISASDGRHVVAVDEASGLISETPGDGEALFTEGGDPAPQVQKVIDFLGRVAKSRTATDSACATLQEHDLIEPWPLQLRTADGEQAVRGVCRIAESRLNELPAETFAELRAGGALAVAYAQLLAQGSVQNLSRLARLQAREAEKDRQSLPDVTDIFQEESNTLAFDWDALDTPSDGDHTH